MSGHSERMSSVDACVDLLSRDVGFFVSRELVCQYRLSVVHTTQLKNVALSVILREEYTRKTLTAAEKASEARYQQL